jgi:hypothetical protein
MTEHAKLPPGQEPMTDEKFEQHRRCETAPREHKWQWKFDILKGGPSDTEAFCIHCGKETTLTHKDQV